MDIVDIDDDLRDEYIAGSSVDLATTQDSVLHLIDALEENLDGDGLKRTLIWVAACLIGAQLI